MSSRLIHCFISRAVSLVLVLSLVCNATPAAPQTIVGLATEWRASPAFWMRVNDFPGRLYRTLAGQNLQSGPQEKQQDRDSKVGRIQIYPGDVTLRVDQRIQFSAIAYRTDGAPVGGVHFTWEGQDGASGEAVPISPHGEFEALIPGKFKITAQGAGRKTQVKVTVLDGPRRPGANEAPISVKKVSNREGIQTLGSLPPPVTNGRGSASARTPEVSRKASAF